MPTREPTKKLQNEHEKLNNLLQNQSDKLQKDPTNDDAAAQKRDSAPSTSDNAA